GGGWMIVPPGRKVAAQPSCRSPAVALPPRHHSSRRSLCCPGQGQVPEELAALGCPNRPPSGALKAPDRETDSNHAERLTGKRVGPASKTPIHRQPNEQVVHEGHLGTPIGRSAKNGALYGWIPAAP